MNVDDLDLSLEDAALGVSGFGKSSRGSPEQGESELASEAAMRNPLAGVSLGVSVHAGFPNPAADRRLQGLDINALLIKQPNSTFMFRIRGQEGITQGIFDGDLAVVDRGLTPRPQDFVLWHDGQRFKLSRPIKIAEDGITWGVITAVVHQYR